VYRAVDQFGQVIDVFMSRRRDARSARRFVEQAIGTTKVIPTGVVTDRAATHPIVMEELLPAAWHRTEQYANNPSRARSRPPEVTAATDARTQAGPQRQG